MSVKYFAGISAFCLTANLAIALTSPVKALPTKPTPSKPASSKPAPSKPAPANPSTDTIPTNTIPADTSPSTWQPIARINTQKPYKIQLINQTDTSLEYSSTTNEFPPRTLQPRTSAVLTQLPLPIYLLISPINPGTNLRYNLSVQNNIVTVKITPLPENDSGNTTVNIQETGGIYVY